ncbi:MAG: hypothetical protein ISR91_02265 [Candidatus Delongbacteria bacterium]|nr:hypothetical protein [Candidatus Delongbacteria bacterium]
MLKQKEAVILSLILVLLLLAGCEEADKNNAPVIEALQATPLWVMAEETVQLNCTVSDPDQDAISFSWSASGGTFTDGDDGDSPTWLAPDTPDYYSISVTVSDGTAIATADCTIPVMLTREAAIPEDAHKWGPDDDTLPPVTLAEGWSQPEPLPGPINSAGGEDAPFITPDGETFFFFFTPDVSVPPEEQLFDGATGLWWSHHDIIWSVPQRILLSDEPALDGCPCSLGNRLWFCSARAGNFGEIDYYIAELVNGVWTDWHNAGARLNADLVIGEMHLVTEQLMYFHWDDAAGSGGLDLWSLEQSGSEWGAPANLGETVNTSADESRPFVSSDGQELWYTANSQQGYPGPSLWRSMRQTDASWGEGEEIIACFAGEPTLDGLGNIYFTHHFFDGGEMMEADIYVAWKLVE